MYDQASGPDHGAHAFALVCLVETQVRECALEPTRNGIEKSMIKTAMLVHALLN